MNRRASRGWLSIVTVLAPGGLVLDAAGCLDYGRADPEPAPPAAAEAAAPVVDAPDAFPVDAASPSFCQGIADAAFCDSFDEGRFHVRWRPDPFNDAGPVAITDAALSPPGALGSTIPAGLSLAGAALRTELGLGRSLRVRGSFRVPESGASPSDYLVLLYLRVGLVPPLSVRLVARPRQAAANLSIVNDADGVVRFTSPDFVASFADWTSVEMTLDIAPSGDLSAALDIAGATQRTDVTGSVLLDSTSTTLGIGATLGSSTLGASTVLVDDVVVGTE